ncbi:MAG: integration host factor subunit alpha [bacterium]|jgi:integration host factor subunit alpha
MALTKADLANKVRSKVGLSTSESMAYVASFFDLIKAEAEDAGTIKLNGFGNFAVKEKKARKGRNPQTGEAIIISERKVVKFKPSVVFKSEINKKYKNGTAGK